jgi:hypothetical protein
MKTKILILTLVLAFLLTITGAALANGGVELPQGVLGGGASDSTVGDISLHATLGQPVVGGASGSGDVALGQGFWHGVNYDIYLPLVMKH